MSTSRFRLPIGIFAAVIAIGLAVGGFFMLNERRARPSRDAQAYETTTRHFFRGLAQLQVGLIDRAIQEFTDATTTAPQEPVVWANLGLAHLRLGAFDAAAPAIERASTLAPASGDVAFLLGRLEIARGRRDPGLAALRRAIALDARNLPARTALIQELENGAAAEADAEAQVVMDQLVALVPENLAVLVERARLAAKRGDAATLKDSVARLARPAAGWPADVLEQFRTLEQDAARASFVDCARDVAFLRNLLVQVPAFLAARRLVTPPADLVAEPLMTFMSLPAPLSTPSPTDQGLTFSSELVGDASSTLTSLVAVSADGDSLPALFTADASSVSRLRASGASGRSSSPVGTPGPSASSATALCALDWNHDFRMDLVSTGPGGVRLYLQSADGSFGDATARAWGDAKAPALDATGAWAADIEMDGDVDLVVGVRAAAPLVLRNNGDGTWKSVQPFGNVVGLRAFAWADLDRDGDADAALVDDAGALHVLANLQAGQFQAMLGPAASKDLRGLAVGDVNADGVFDVVTLDASGALTRSSWADDRWTSQALASQPSGPTAGPGRTAGTVQSGARVFVVDLDNNGAVDVVVSDSAATILFLGGADHTFTRSSNRVDAQVWSIADLNGDGQLDLAGLAGGRPVRLIGRGTRGYHYQVVRARAQRAAGDQRVNTFGIGSELEVRSGLLIQKQIIDGPAMHVGLGARSTIDVTRILWPNGVPQVEFDAPIDAPLVAEQRLKGSCPWVFADDGSGMKFVTDFLWRSPLGLRINAQDTAGITQTEDWVRIRGDQLVAREGAYDVRITAELWETHFVDYTSLFAVDHPPDVAVFVDERFAREAPKLAVRAMRTARPIAQAWDQSGTDVTDIVRRLDGRALDTFARGAYQGVATDHFVEIDVGAEMSANAQPWLIAQGWIYPTDSSINVAIGQGAHDTPRGIALEAQDATGRWVTVAPDLGFPAGKNKSILIDLSRLTQAGLPRARRLRLRTNLEIYWDALSVAEGAPEGSFKITRVAPTRADLRYRGFSVTERDRRDRPEVPIYDRLANTAPRWRDLEGFYTRFGDVRELLTGIDDRYVIMNAGDELRMSFPAAPVVEAGWVRDFVLAGDGWVKDGDYNTSNSKTVLPLPQHGHPDYAATTGVPSLARDPIYRQHRADWYAFHTRLVAPDFFLGGLRPAPRLDAR